MLSRRKFLKAGALWIPTAPFICRALPNLSFHGKSKMSNGLLNSLAGYWKFDQSINGANVPDATGNGWTAVNQNNTTFYGNGLINQCAAMGINNNGFSVPATIISGTSTGSSFSIQSWCFGPTSGDNSAIIGQVLPNIYWDVFYLVAGNTLGFQVHNNANTNFQVSSTNNLIAPGWHQVCAGFDAANSQIWIQVDLETRQTLGGVTSVKRTNDQVLALGNYSTFVTAYTNRIDEFGLWLRVLEVADVVLLNNSGAGLPFSAFS